MPSLEDIQREDSMDDPAPGGPGGPSLGRRGSIASQSTNPPGPAGTSVRGASEPGRSDRPRRKGSVRAGSVSGSALGDTTAESLPQQSFANHPNATPTPIPAAPLARQPIPVALQPAGSPPAGDLSARLAHANTYDLPQYDPRRADYRGPPAVTHLQRYQTALANSVDPVALSALQNESVADPLLESLDPFLGRRAASPALGALARGVGTPRQADLHLSQQDVSQMDPGVLKALVNVLAREGGGGGGGGGVGSGVLPERVNVSPPRTPPAAVNKRDPADIIGAVEKREMERAAQALLEEGVEGVEIRRRALDHYYATGHDTGLQVCVYL